MEFLSVSATRLSSSIRDQSSRVTPHLAVLHFLVKPGFCHPQIAADGNRGNFQCLCDFLHGESAKIAKFDSFAFSRIDLLECCQTAVEGYKVPAALLLKADCLIQRHFDPCALACMLPARVVHQDLAHQSRRHAEEMRAVLPSRIGLIDKPHVSFVDNRGWLQRVPLVFFAQVAGGKLAKFAVHQRRQVIERPLVSVRPFSQQYCYFVGIRHSSRIDNTELPSWAEYTPASP